MSEREITLRMIAAQFPHWQHPWDDKLLAEAEALGDTLLILVAVLFVASCAVSWWLAGKMVDRIERKS